MAIPADVEQALADWHEAERDVREASWSAAMGNEQRKTEHRRAHEAEKAARDRLVELIDAYATPLPDYRFVAPLEDVS